MRKPLVLLVLLLCCGLAFAGLPVINWAPSVSFCQGNSVTLNATNPSSTYMWNTGATTPTITVAQAGQYWVTVTNSSGSVSDTIQVYVDSIPNLDLGPDRTMCASNNPVLIAPYSPSYTYSWNTGATTHQIPVTSSGTYYVTINNSCGVFHDTVNIVLENAPTVNLGPDIWNCAGLTKRIGISTNHTGTVHWNTGATTDSISVINGTYFVKVSNSCGDFYDTIHVFQNLSGSVINGGDTIEKCPNSPVTLSAISNSGTFLWSTGATTSSIAVSSLGSYWLKYTNPCGTYYDTVYVINKPPPQVNLGPDISVCEGQASVLNAGNPGSSYVWSTGDATQTINVGQAGTYWVGVNNGCGMAYDTINVTVIPKISPDIKDSVFRCQNGAITVDAGQWGNSTQYLWDDGSTNRTHSYSANGQHSVQVTNSCFSVTKNFVVALVPPGTLDLGHDTTICGSSDTILSNLPPRGYSFLWSNGADTNFIIVAQTGDYWVAAMTPCDTAYDTVHVVFPNDADIIGPRTRTFCVGSPLTLSSPNYPEVQYLWSTGDTTPNITVTQVGVYSLMTYNGCDTTRDTVQLIPVTNTTINLGPDTVICIPNTLLLDVSGQPLDSVVWNTGSHNANLPVQNSGTYWVHLYNACGEFSDTITVTFVSPPIRQLTGKTICRGSTTVLSDAQSNVSGYLWNTGATTSSITVQNQGWYWVKLTNSCTTLKDSAYVFVDDSLPQINLGKDTVFCAGTLVLNPGNFPHSSYVWSDGSYGKTLTVTKSGTYYVGIGNSCNVVFDTINVLITGPPKPALGDSIVFCRGSVFNLNAKNPGCTYLWNDGSSGQYLAVDTPGVYWCTITNLCGQLTDTIAVFLDDPLDHLELGNDTLICEGDSLVLDTKYPGVTTLWSDGSTDQTLIVKTTGVYSVAISNTCGTWRDSIYVLVEGIPYFSLGNDVPICAVQGSVKLDGPSGMRSYLWSNGDTTQSTTYYTSGNKWLEVANDCFSASDTIMLYKEYPIDMDLGTDTALCFGESLILDPGVTQYPVSWSDNTIGPTMEVTRSGTYFATAQNSCGIFSDTIHVRFDYPLDPQFSDTLVCSGDSAVFDLRDLPYTVLWSDGSTSKRRLFGREGIYHAAISNKCGTYTKDFKVEISDCNCPLYVPNAFTPNGDAINDDYYIGYDCNLTSYKIKIFNRWGEAIFESTDPRQIWHGTASGKPAPEGVYTYSISYKWNVYGADHASKKTGTITLYR